MKKIYIWRGDNMEIEIKKLTPELAEDYVHFLT